MDFEALLKDVGEFGKYQKQLILLLCMPALFSGILATFGMLMLHQVPHRCATWNGDTYQNKDARINESIPYIDGKLSRCLMIKRGHNFTFKCDIWVFDRTYVKENVVMEFNLVCDVNGYIDYARITYTLGQAVGCIVMGVLADRYGRKIMLLLTLTVIACANLGLFLAKDIQTFLIIRMVCAFGTNGAYLLVYIIGLEMVGCSMRLLFCILIELVWVCGLFSMTLLGMFLSSWREVQLLLAVLSTLLLGIWWKIPESPRWLLANKRLSECDEILQMIAKKNMRQLPIRRISATPDDLTTSSVTLGDMFHPVILKRFSILTCSFTLIGMMYNDTSLEVRNKNIYLNYIVSGIEELLGCMLPVMVPGRVGRKHTLMLSMISSGIAYILTLIPIHMYDADMVTTVVSKLAKSLSIGAFVSAIAFTSELFPTILRCTGLGLIFMVGRIGSMLPPYVSTILKGYGIDDKTYGILRRNVIGILSILMGTLALCLSDTENKRLPEDLDDILEKSRPVRNRLGINEPEVSG